MIMRKRDKPDNCATKSNLRKGIAMQINIGSVLEQLKYTIYIYTRFMLVEISENVKAYVHDRVYNMG